MNSPSPLRSILVKRVEEVKRENHILSLNLFLFRTCLHISEMLVFSEVCHIFSSKSFESSVASHLMSWAKSIGSLGYHTCFVINGSHYKSKSVDFFQISWDYFLRLVLFAI